MTVGTNLVNDCSYVAAGLLAASKMFSVAQPLWNKLPKWLVVVLPVLVLDLPQVASALAGVTSTADLTTALVTSVALLLPGIEKAEANPPAAS